jgi:hypothetical protein
MRLSGAAITPIASVPRSVESDHGEPAFFVIEGILSIMYALEHKRELTGQWGWMLASGIIDLVLAVPEYRQLCDYFTLVGSMEPKPVTPAEKLNKLLLSC